MRRNWTALCDLPAETLCPAWKVASVLATPHPPLYLRAMLSDIHIVLVETTHPGNIGAVARAMKAMGLGSLRLVKPRCFPSAEATARASGADDLLARARVLSSLEEALADCQLVVGTSNRQRTIDLPLLDPRQMAENLAARPLPAAVAILFGPEHSGLSNAQLDRCHWQVAIPTAKDFASLNLAAAVQVVAYELRMAAAVPAPSSRPSHAPVSMAEMERFYHHLETVLVEIGFLDPANPKQLMRRLRRLYNRVQPDANEINILRGILTAVQRSGATSR